MITGKPLFTVKQIQDKVAEIAAEISTDYSESKDLVVVPILKGAFMFASDLVRQIKVPLTIDFVLASSYVQSESSGDVTLHCGLRENIRDKDVLLIEDIVDTGVTLNYLRERFMQKGPRSVKICGLLNKEGRRTVDIDIDYQGFDIPNIFVVGYGLDYDNKYRNLPYIAEFRKTNEEG
jgi:hypoxanthine phosphoribosyltransferase